MSEDKYSPSIWDQDLSGRAEPPAPLGPAMPPAAVEPYSPGTFGADLAPPMYTAPPPKPPDNRPFLTRADETAGDAIRAFTNAVTFGNMDRLAGAGDYYTGRGGPSNLSDLVKGVRAPQSYDEAVDRQVNLTQQAEARSPTASLAGGLVGAAALPGFGAEALAAKFGKGAAARFGGYGAVGAGVGAAQGAGNTYSGEASDYAKNALLGGGIGGLTGGVLGSALGSRPSVSAAKTPAAAETWAATDHVYDALRANKAIYENPYLATEADKVAANTSHIWPGFIPATNHAIEQMRASTATPGGGNTTAEIERIREGVNKIPRGDPAFATDRTAANQVRNAIDDFYTNPPLGAVRVGHEAAAREAGDTAQLGRRLFQGASHAQDWENLVHNADVSSRGSHLWGGKSRDDYIFDAVKNMQHVPEHGVASPLAGYSAAEKAALDRITQPGRLQRGLRTASDYMGGSAGLAKPIGLALTGAGGGYAAGQYLGMDPITTAALGAAIPVTGGGLRVLSNRIGRSAIDNASEIIHQSNPLYDYRVMMAGTKPGPGFPATNDAARNALAIELAKQQNPYVLPPVTVEGE